MSLRMWLWRQSAAALVLGVSAAASGGVRYEEAFTFSFLATDSDARVSVSGAGDVNDDGFADVIFGASHDDTHGNNSGTAWVFSGIDGSQLYEFNGPTAGARSG